MRVLVACTRGAGHFNPLVPFIAACRRGGHEVLVVGPPALAEPVDRAGLEFWPGAAPPEDELGPVWAQVPTAVPRGGRAAGRRRHLRDAERARDAAGHARRGAASGGPTSSCASRRSSPRRWSPTRPACRTCKSASASPSAYVELMSLAGEAVEAWGSGLTQRIAASPYLTLFPAVAGGPGRGRRRRVRTASATPPPRRRRGAAGLVARRRPPARLRDLRQRDRREPDGRADLRRRARGGGRPARRACC